MEIALIIQLRRSLKGRENREKLAQKNTAKYLSHNIKILRLLKRYYQIRMM